MAGWLLRAGLAAMALFPATRAGAAIYEGYPSSVADGVMVGDVQPEQDRSVMVSDAVAGPYLPGEELATGQPAEWGGQSFQPSLAHRIFGPACPRWVGQADVLLLWQGNVPATPLLTLDAVPYPTLLAGNQLANGLATGPRTAIILNVDKCNGVEANYFNAGNFAGTRVFAAPAAGQMAWDALGNFNVGNINSGSMSTAGYIQSLELNWRRSNGGSITWLAGARWIEWHDSLALTDAYDDGVSEPGTDTLAAQTVNNLYGGQVGADAVLLTLFDVLRFNGIAKAGIYCNSNASATMTVGGDRVPATTYTANGNSTGFFGEIGVNGSVRLTDHIFWRAGYNFFWISGVATSLNQVQRFDMTVPSGQLNLGGSVFLQGINTGIEAVW